MYVRHHLSCYIPQSLSLHGMARLGIWMVVVVGCGPAEQPLDDATKHLIAADEAKDAGNKEKALEELSAAIAVEPDVWSYYRRAKLHLEMNNPQAALHDCEAGLAIDPDHEQLKWLRGEARKPANRRFRGRNKEAPSSK